MDVQNAIWLIAPMAEVAVIGLLFYRKVWRTLPFFCVYCIWDLVSNLLVLGVSQYSPNFYFHAFFAQAALDAALIFCVLVELAWSVLRPVRASLPRSTLVVVAVLILVAGAVIWPFAALPGLAHTTTREGVLFAQLQETTSILRVLFFLLLAAGSQLLAISWRDRELQVATGFGLYSIVSLTVAVIETHLTNSSSYVGLFQFTTISYICSLLYWVISFAQKEAERREFTPQMRSFLLAVAGAARSTRVALTDSRTGKPSGQDKN